MILYVLFTIACLSPSSAARQQLNPSDSSDHETDTSFPTGDSDSVGIQDSEPVVSPTTGNCPQGMVGVPADAPIFCIDAFEVTWDGATAVSEQGVTPTSGLTYDESVAACESTPAYDASGTLYAYKHLATSEEWEAAADGVYGEGGLEYPFGDEWDDTACVTPTSTDWPYDEVQVTGLLPTCISPVGAYDMVGNLWEWMDSGYKVDPSTALWVFEEAGIELDIDASGLILLVAGDADDLALSVVNVQPFLSVTEDGWLYVPDSQVTQPTFGDGYLQLDGGTTDPSGFYPIRVEQDVNDASIWWVYSTADTEAEQPIPDKRGCAYYVGNEESCDPHLASMVHTHDFSGTIGFRCAVEPF